MSQETLNNDVCEHSDDIVSYIYDELASIERGAFERHLSGCTVCTDDFAAISNARFSVFEWQREEFADLPTPQISIPYDRPVAVSAGTASVASYLKGLVASLRLSPAIAGAAVIIMLAVAGLVAYLSLAGRGVDQVAISEKKDDLIASNVAQKTIDPNEAIIAPPVTPQQPDIAAERDEKASVKIGAGEPTNRHNKRSGADAGRNKVKIHRGESGPTVSKAPKLSNFDEVEDKSLRLADLFEQVDSI